MVTFDSPFIFVAKELPLQTHGNECGVFVAMVRYCTVMGTYLVSYNDYYISQLYDEYP